MNDLELVDLLLKEIKEKKIHKCEDLEGWKDFTPEIQSKVKTENLLRHCNQLRVTYANKYLRHAKGDDLIVTPARISRYFGITLDTAEKICDNCLEIQQNEMEEEDVLLLKENGVKTSDDWFKKYPPEGKEIHWKTGRSAKELANYITVSLPYVPQEMSYEISKVSKSKEPFEWAGEVVTPLPELPSYNTGGRHHDMVLSNNDICVCVEAKTDESLGNYYVKEEYDKASNNKKYRINQLIKMIYGSEIFECKVNLSKIRYQLITALSGTILEAKNKNLNKAMFLIIVFLKQGKNDKNSAFYSKKKVNSNDEDIKNFTLSLNLDNDNHIKIDGIDVWIKELKISLK